MKVYTLSAGAVPVRFKNNHWEYLILRAYKYWDFPKGMVEKDEDPWVAAIREVEEETGLSVFSTPFGLDFIETAPYGKSKVARVILVPRVQDVLDWARSKLVP
jgi:bis(5'-nucleosidyl)-tetraphosphatase